VNAVDRDVIPDPSGRVDEYGRAILVPNPYNVVISVMMLKEGWDVRNVKVIVPLRTCDSRTLTEQTLGRGLRKMHVPELDEDGGANPQSEDLYVIEHPSFAAILDQISDLVERKDSDEIDHPREYVPVVQRADLEERRVRGVRLLKFLGLVEVVPDWSQTFDVNRLPALAPRLGWKEEIPESEITTYLKRALGDHEEAGQTFTLPDVPSYRDFDRLIEVAYALPLLRELRTGFQHKTAVKRVVRQFLERKTFAIPAGMPLSFDHLWEGEAGRIALGNLSRSDILVAVRQALKPVLHEAIAAPRRSTQHSSLSARASSRDYQAIASRRRRYEKVHVHPNGSR
jgi:hypothetical protein